MNERIINSETTQVRIAFPNTLNDHETLFGGVALKWMDEVAYITATRFLRRRAVTVSIEKVRFLRPVKPDAIVELTGRVSKAGNVKIEVHVEVTTEEMYTGKKEKAIEAVFIFAAIDENHNPVRLSITETDSLHLFDSGQPVHVMKKQLLQIQDNTKG